MNTTEILTQIQTSINWTVFALVIAIGYFVRATPILKQYSTTTKLLLFSFIAVTAYVYFAKVDVATAIASYFITVGFHTLIIKQIERTFFIGKNKHIRSTTTQEEEPKSDIVGDRPDDR